MVDQDAAQSGGAACLSALREAEGLVISALENAGAVFRALSHTEASASASCSGHAEQFARDLFRAQALIQGKISNLSNDLPFENSTLLRLVDAELSIQRTAHVHRALVDTLARVRADDVAAEQPPLPGTTAAPPSAEDLARQIMDAAMQGTVTEEVLDSSGMAAPPPGV